MPAMVTGAAGQDGLIMCQRLSNLGYEVIATVRPGQSPEGIQTCANDVEVHELDLADPRQVRSFVQEVSPTLVFNFGGISSLTDAHDDPERTWTVNFESVVAMLEGIRSLQHRGHEVRFLQASSALAVRDQQEVSHCPYSNAKFAAMRSVAEARQKHGIFATSAILYSHESPLRTPAFFTRRVTMGVARIARGLSDHLSLHSTSGFRDWGWAPEYVEACRLMLNMSAPEDLILATGKVVPIREFVALAFESIGSSNWQDYVSVNENGEPPIAPSALRGDPRQAAASLGWRSTSTIPAIAQAMVSFDLKLIDDQRAMWCPDFSL